MGRFYSMLPPRAKTFRELMLEAIEASEAVGKYYELPIPDAGEAMHLEAAASDAEHAFKEFLFELGATRDLLRRAAKEGILA